jgi:hypothetical protein
VLDLAGRMSRTQLQQALNDDPGHTEKQPAAIPTHVP